MAEIVHIAVADLLLDPGNPRLGGSAASQQETAVDLARQQGDSLVRFAEHIVKYRLDPTSVTPKGDRRKQYRVIEGNRRVLALKALVAPVLKAAANRRLAKLAAKSEQDPIQTIACALFDPDDEREALGWVALRHTGPNQGVGIVPWGSTERGTIRGEAQGNAPAAAGECGVDHDSAKIPCQEPDRALRT